MINSPLEYMDTRTLDKYRSQCELHNENYEILDRLDVVN
jgi:hypothetical protein